MNIEEWLTQELTTRGLWEEQSAAIMDIIKADKSARGVRWSELVEGYPDAFRGALLMFAGSEAVAWIDENCPRAWFRSVFAELAGLDE